MKIRVEQKHIDNGKAGSPHCCPIALALKEQNSEGIYENERWAVYPDLGISVEVFEDGRWLRSIGRKRIHLSYEINRFIEEFDSDVLANPFKFEIQYPNNFHCAIAFTIQ